MDTFNAVGQEFVPQVFFDPKQLIIKLLHYIIEGVAVALVASFVPTRKMNVQEIMAISITASATFAILDIFSPKVGDASRFGLGFSLGNNMLGAKALPLGH